MAEVGYAKPPLDKQVHFQPGVSGNPNGRPKGAVSIMRRYQHFLEQPSKDDPNISRGEKLFLKYLAMAEEAAQLPTEKQLSEGRLSVQAQEGIRAFNAVLDRAYGKPVQRVESENKDVQEFSSEQDELAYLDSEIERQIALLESTEDVVSEAQQIVETANSERQ